MNELLNQIQTQIEAQVRRELAAQGTAASAEIVEELVRTELETMASFLIALYRNRDPNLPPPPPQRLLAPRGRAPTPTTRS